MMKCRWLTGFWLALCMICAAGPAFAETAHTLSVPVSIRATGAATMETRSVFLVAEGEYCPMPEGSADGVCMLSLNGSGDGAFPPITFDRMGVFSYAISQAGEGSGLHYDDTVYALTVYITRGATGTEMSVMLTQEGQTSKLDRCAFVNQYGVTVENPPVSKTVRGDTPDTAEAFDFTLKPVGNTAGVRDMPMPTGAKDGVKTISVTAGSEVEFGAMTFAVPGVYVYEVAEVNDAKSGYRYDTAVYRITYTVAAANDTLSCQRAITRNGSSYSQSVVAFSNRYSRPSSGGGGGGGSGSSDTRTVSTVVSPTSTPGPTPEPTASPTPTPEPTPEPTPTPTPMTAIDGWKVWEDEGNAHGTRPNTVTLHLFADGELVADATPIWTGRSGDRWSFTFGELPEVDDAGRRISYTIMEDSVPYYQSSVSGTTITNTLEAVEPSGYTSISGSKLWVDEDDADGIRPGYIVVRLLRNGAPYEQRTVLAASGWSYTFDGLPLDDGYGHTYQYAIREDPVEGYYTGYLGDDIVNIYTPIMTQNIDGYGTAGFGQMSEQELEDLLELLGYLAPKAGVPMQTGDEIPLWPFIYGAIGVFALALYLFLYKRRDAGRR